MIELEPILTYGIEALAAVVLMIGGFALNKLRQKLNIDKENELWEVLDQEMERAVDAAEAKLLEKAKKVDIETKSELIQTAGNLLAEQAPKTLRRTGLTPQAVANRLEGVVRARLD